MIVINFIILHDSQNTENNEIKYLFLVSVEDESERSASEDFDASIIEGGVVKVVIDSRHFAEEVGVLSTDISGESGEDILYSYFAYLGAFGWEYIGIDENTFIFSRTS